MLACEKVTEEEQEGRPYFLGRLLVGRNEMLNDLKGEPKGEMAGGLEEGVDLAVGGDST